MTNGSAMPDGSSGQRPSGLSEWLDELPYLAMLVLAVGGVAYTSLAPGRSTGFWQVLVVIFALFCIAAGWRRASGSNVRSRLVLTQALHWGALLVCMQVLYLPNVQRMLTSDAAGLALIALMALGTFLAGVHALSWRICVTAVAMALAVPLIAFIEQAAVLLLVLGALFVIGFIAVLWYRHRNELEPA
jgi:hypothetical protein